MANPFAAGLVAVPVEDSLGGYFELYYNGQKLPGPIAISVARGVAEKPSEHQPATVTYTAYVDIQKDPPKSVTVG